MARRAPTVVELKQLLNDLESEAFNYGETSSVGKLCFRARDALYALAREVLDTPR